jgi:hypothetical protein
MARFLGYALCVLVISTLFVSPVAPTKLERKLVLGAGASPKITKAVPQKDLPKDECTVCIEFFDEAIQELLNAIANGGIIGGCSELCVVTGTLYPVCEVLCLIIGFDAFVDLINITDPDSIYYCQYLSVCPIVPGGAANITELAVVPPVGHAGDSFTITMDFKVTQATGTGTILFLVLPPDALPWGDAEVNEGLQPNVYTARLQFTATPSEAEPFSPGTYIVQGAVCDGECGSNHPYSQVFSVRNTTFTIK